VKDMPTVVLVVAYSVNVLAYEAKYVMPLFFCSELWRVLPGR
jgi:hypothetical protein